ncbi:MAG: thiamine-phosphate kinase [Pseudomonadales bacterium]
MDEFSLIERYFSQPAAAQSAQRLALGIGDDCALISLPEQCDLVFSIDTMVESVHFPEDAEPENVAWRLLGASVSDLAAMGARAHSFTLALTLPQRDELWLEGFSRGLFDAAKRYDIALAGGDTTRGPLTLSAQVQGVVPRGEALLRSGAGTGDGIYVTGCLGDSRAGLSLLASAVSNAHQSYLLERYYRPAPRLQSGEFIRPFASACIDVSDGLLADLGHILKRSGCGAVLYADKLPLSAALLATNPTSAIDWALSGGEDFELCFCVPAEQRAAFEQASISQAVNITGIGEITSEAGIVLHRDGMATNVVPSGYKHFEG